MIWIFFVPFYVFMHFFLETDGKKKSENFAVEVIQFPIKWYLFQPSWLKTVGEDTFLAAKS